MITLTPGRKIRQLNTSSVMANAAYKRSWRDIFIRDRGGMPEKPKDRGRLVENDVVMEILKNRISTATCKSLRKNRSGFRTFSTSPGGDSSLSQAERKI